MYVMLRLYEWLLCGGPCSVHFVRLSATCVRTLRLREPMATEKMPWQDSVEIPPTS